MKNSHDSLRLRSWLNYFLILAVALLAGPVQSAGAVGTNLYVSSDGNDSGTCSTLATACATVNYAVSQAASGSIIHIGAGTFGTVDLLTGKSLTFKGEGRDVTFLDGGGAMRVFAILSVVDTTIMDMTITHGNSGAGQCGGGIYLTGGTLFMTRLKVTANAADAGAGICSYGSLTLRDSEVSANTANISASSYAGAMHLNGTGVTDILTNVTISDNSATGDIGGINIGADNSSSGSITLKNVTISGNSAFENTGLNIGGHAHVTITNSTIANNQGSNPGFPGGIDVFTATVTIKNSIVAGNTPFNCRIVSGVTWNSQGNNIDGGGNCQFTDAGLHDQQNIDPRLGPLVDNGGPVKTIALLPGSPALDGVTYNAPNGCPPTDARGVTRPFGAYCDIGAFEANFVYFYLPMILK